MPKNKQPSQPSQPSNIITALDRINKMISVYKRVDSIMNNMMIIGQNSDIPPEDDPVKIKAVLSIIEELNDVL